jgi:hypothetical protein
MRIADPLALEIPLQVERFRRTLTALAAACPTIETTLTTGPLAIAQAFDRAVEQAGADETLSAQGRQAAIAQAGRAAAVALDGWSAAQVAPLAVHREGLERGLLTLGAPLVVPTDPTARLTLELQRQEIRGSVRPLGPLEWEALHATTKDSAILDALESAPPTVFRAAPDAPAQLMPFVSEARIAARRLARAAEADPATASELRDVASIERVYRSAVATVRTALVSVLPDLRTDLDSGVSETTVPKA